MQNLNLPNIWPVTCHTDHVGPNSTFVAIKGQATDGLAFILLALQKGASKIVVDNSVVNQDLQVLVASFGAQLMTVANTRAALSNLSAQAWGLPAQKLKIIGFTGTKGKTTSVYALRHILAKMGKQVAMLTGVENMISELRASAQLTTPQPDFLHMFLAQCVLHKIEYVIMEASAQAFSLNRLDDLLFTGVVFTNLELEHSEFYPDIDTYFAAKCQIFKQLRQQAFVILNGDDHWVQTILAKPNNFFNPALNLKIIKFGSLPGLAQDPLMVSVLRSSLAKQNVSNPEQIQDSPDNYYLDLNTPDLTTGLNFNLITQKAAANYQVKNIFGTYNAYNLTGAILCASELGLNVNQIAQAISDFSGAPGRLEIYALPNGARGVVDYAHTPSSFRNVLKLLRTQTKHLIVVFGAGGGRDQLKRPVMGQIAQELCDVVILTNDNPRHEDPLEIINQIVGAQLVSNFLVELDRAKAIKLAYQLSMPDSIIVLLGKGPDEYQMIGMQKTFFSDREQLLSCV